MVNILSLDPNLYLNFIIILLRVSGIFITAPILGSNSVPRTLRVFMALLISLIMFNVVPIHGSLPSLSTGDYFLICVKELMVGLLLGIVPKLFFAAVDFAGTVMGFQMGFSIANVVDPQTDVQVSIIASFKGVVATLLFLALDGHHIFLEVMGLSYQKIPIMGFLFTPNKIDYLLRISADLFIIGLQIGAPIIVALMLANIILGFMARSIPQMNVFVVGFPFTIGLGFVLLYIGMPYMTLAITRAIQNMGNDIINLLEIMAK
ncbi:MAG: flagellar biosynthetic protein FliR [Deltaproteobacteria bacterium]|nr:flagellar biosynthetic protein FliR [Deltaproteobacteria bacterium]